METRTLLAKDFRKEINIIPMERMVETRGISSAEKEVFTDKRLFERNGFETPALFEEISNNRHEKMIEKIERMKEAKRRQVAFRNSSLVKNLKFYALTSAIVVSILATTFSLKKQMDIASSPVVVVTNDIMSNIGLHETDNGRPVSPKEFDKYDTEELYQYIENESIDIEDIKQEIQKFCKINFLDYDFAIEKINEMYPELELSIEKSKGL